MRYWGEGANHAVLNPNFCGQLVRLTSSHKRVLQEA
jgi:hypothetical protein